MKNPMRKLINAATFAGAFALTPAFADEAVIVPDHRDTTVIHENERRSDGPVIIEKDRQPDAVIVDRDRHYSNGGSSGEVGVGVDLGGVGVETHSHNPR
jgi:hypothetical protein